MGITEQIQARPYSLSDQLFSSSCLVRRPLPVGIQLCAVEFDALANRWVDRIVPTRSSANYLRGRHQSTCGHLRRPANFGQLSVDAVGHCLRSPSVCSTDVGFLYLVSASPFIGHAAWICGVLLMISDDIKLWLPTGPSR